MDDRELLHQYVANHSERAFAELVARHLSVVLATAQRLVPEPQMAADVAQTVFIQLARKAWTIRPEQVLSGWLYRATRRHALNLLRAEQRRLHRETLAMKFAETENAADHTWENLAPLVDEALHQLKRGEQDALLLRFFEDKSYGEVGRILNLDEKTACQRVNRALEKMRLHFSRRGVTTTAALLGATLSAHAATAVPAEMAANVAGASLTSAGGAALSGSLLKTLFMTLTTKTALAVTAILTVATLTTIHQQHELSTLHTQLADATAKTHAAAVKKPTLAELETTVGKMIAAYTAVGNYASTMVRVGELADFAKSLDPASARALLDFVDKMPANAYRQTAEAVLLGAWTKGDPEAALGWAQSHIDKFHSRDAYYAIFSSWSEKDPVAALAAVDQAGLPALSSQLRNEILSAVGGSDPRRALELYSSLPPSEQPDTGYSFLGALQNDPAAAIAALINIPSSAARNSQLGQTLDIWMMGGEANSQAALALIKTLPPSDGRNQMLGLAMMQLGFNNDLTDAISSIGNLPSGPERDGYVNEVVSNIGRFSTSVIDFPAALAWVDQVTPPGPAQNDAETALLSLAGDKDPVTASTLIEQTSDPTVRDVIIPKLAGNWAQTDPQSALAWVQSLPDDANTQQQAINNVMNSWVTSDPATAAAYIQQNLSGDSNYSKLITKAAGNWAGQDPATALDWAESLSPGPAQDNAVSRVVSVYAKIDPAAAWSIAQQMPVGGNRDQSLGNILVAWSNQNPSQAVALLGDLPAGTVQDNTTVKVATNWIKQDPANASAWIDTLPEGPARDGSVVALISAEGINNLPTAFAWAASIGDSAVQATQLNTVVQEWAGKDPAAATDAVQSANLTDEQRATLLAAIQNATAAK